MVTVAEQYWMMIYWSNCLLSVFFSVAVSESMRIFSLQSTIKRRKLIVRELHSNQVRYTHCTTKLYVADTTLTQRQIKSRRQGRNTRLSVNKYRGCGQKFDQNEMKFSVCHQLLRDESQTQWSTVEPFQTKIHSRKFHLRVQFHAQLARTVPIQFRVIFFSYHTPIAVQINFWPSPASRDSLLSQHTAMHYDAWMLDVAMYHKRLPHRW